MAESHIADEAKKRIMQAKSFQDIEAVFKVLFHDDIDMDAVAERLHAIFTKLMKYVTEYEFPVFEDTKRFNSRDEIRKFLEGIRPQEVKALKLGSHEEYTEFLKVLVEKLFPEDSVLAFRIDLTTGELDFDHFTKDADRSEYLHTLQETISDSHITVQTIENTIEKTYFIKKYFDSDIQKDIWDMVVFHRNVLVTKFSRKGNNRGRSSVEKLME